MFGYPEKKQVELQYTLEFNENSPRLRLSILAYLLENGFSPADDGFYDLADNMAAFVSGGIDDFMVTVEGLLPPEVPEEEQADEQIDPTQDHQGYNYL